MTDTPTRRRYSRRERRIAIYGALNAAVELGWELGDFSEAEGEILDRIAVWSRRAYAPPRDKHEHEHAEALALHLATEALDHARRFEVIAGPMPKDSTC